MTKKDYIRAVDVINDRAKKMNFTKGNFGHYQVLVHAFADFFEQEAGSKFNRQKFIDACYL